MIEITQKQYDELLNKLNELKDEIDELKVKDEWYKTEDKLTLYEDIEVNNSDKITLETNYKSWEDCKNINEEDKVLYIELIEGSGNLLKGLGLTLNDVRKLRDYLNHKIEYLES